MSPMSMSHTMSQPDGLSEWIAPERTALCVIDIQADFASPEGLVAGYGVDMSAVPGAIANTEKLIAAVVCR